MSITGNESCDKLIGIDFVGNVIPPIWYKTILKTTGKSDMLAINILGDIVYWYRATPIRDEITSQVIGHKKKFKADLLQKTYSNYAEMFGVSKGQVTEAMNRLEDLGIIKREFRTIVIQNGKKLGNVLFIDLNVENLMKFCKEPSKINDFIPIPKKHDSPISLKTDSPMPKKPETNTYTTSYTENDITKRLKDKCSGYTEDGKNKQCISATYYAKDSLDLTIICIKEFDRRYMKRFGEHHSPIRDSRIYEQLNSIFLSNSYYSENEDKEFQAGFDIMILAMDKYFNTKYSDCDYKIWHFLSDGILTNLLRKVAA